MAGQSRGDTVVSLPTDPRLYRLWCLRRLFLLCLALPIVAALALALVTGGTAPFARAGFAIPALLIWALLLIALLIRFPRAAGEILVYALTLTIMVLLWPLASWLMAQSPQGMTPMHVAGIGFLALLLFLALVYLLLGGLVRLLARPGPHPMLRRRLRLRIDLPPDQVLAILRPSPNSSDALTRSGAADAQGRIPVWIKPPRLPPGAPPAPPPALMASPDYWQQIVEEESLSLATVTVTAKGAQETVHLALEPVPGGTLLHQRSADNVLGLAEALFYWLEDVGRDHLTAVLDEARGRPRRALRLLPLDGPMVWLARRIPAGDQNGI